MYKVIENHFRANKTFVFKFKDEVYVINGCTLYKHSDDTVKERVYKRHGVKLCYGDDIDKIACDITEDITREELFFILHHANQFNLLDANGTVNYIEDVGIKEIREWYLGDIDTVLKHIEFKGTVARYYALELLEHVGLNDLPNNTLRYIINEFSEKYLNIKDLHKLDNIFSILKQRYHQESLVDTTTSKTCYFNEEIARTMLRSLKCIIVGSNKIHVHTFLDYDNLKRVIKYMRDNICVGEYNHEGFIPRFIEGLSRNTENQAIILMDMGIQELLTVTEYANLFKYIVEKVYFYEGSTEFIKHVSVSSGFMKKVTSNKQLRDAYIKLVDDHNNTVLEIKNAHDKWLMKVND